MLGGAYGCDDARRATVYARGWLLAHYLTFEPKRVGQLDRYIALLAEGRAAPLDAARGAFGDLKALDRELSAYAVRKRLSGVEIKPASFKPVAIAITALDPASAAIHPLRMKLKRGAQGATSPELLARIRAVAASAPAHGLSQVTLAEAELLAGEADRAEAAADRALAADPKSGEAMLLKGRAIAERARKAGASGKAGFAAARSWFSKANALDTEDPEPLMLFYRSYVWQGAAPTSDAIAALHYASDLAPFDRALRMSSAELYLKAGKLAEARRTIAPLAFDPHNRGLAQTARAVLATIDATLAAPRQPGSVSDR
jgi:predicted Zn-dependent protease